MDNVISFSAREAIEAIMWICGLLITVSGATAVIVKVLNNAKAPNRKQDERIASLENVTGKHEEYLNVDKKRLDGLDAERRVIMKALLALLRHGIDGNDIKAMQDVKNELTTMLINK